MIELKCNRGDTHVRVFGNRDDVIAEATILIERLLKSLGHQATAAVLSKVTIDFVSNDGIFGQEVPHE